MKNFVVMIWLLAPGLLVAQPSSIAIEAQNLTLKERYEIMKDKSQTFKNYKVINEGVLDGVWRITNDSIKAIKATVRETRENVARLESEIKNVQELLKQKEESMMQVEHASTHIEVLGIDFSKGFFIGLVGVIIATILVLLGLISGRLRFLQRNLKDKSDTVKVLNNEFEDYKRKALDKQMKLSRELQNERNRLQELGHAN
jgi:chromosome segregation ATPase